MILYCFLPSFLISMGEYDFLSHLGLQIEPKKKSSPNSLGEVDVVKYLLVHRRAALEDLLVSKLNRGQLLDVLHGGFDKLLTGSLSAFFEWL